VREWGCLGLMEASMNRGGLSRLHSFMSPEAGAGASAPACCVIKGEGAGGRVQTRVCKGVQML